MYKSVSERQEQEVERQRAKEQSGGEMKEVVERRF